MSGFIEVRKADGTALPLRVRRCDTFLCRLRGLTFRRSIGPEEALLFVETSEGRLSTAIHMFFVFFSIGVVWLNSAGVVVDAVVARPFRPYYAPRAPAKYFLEGPPDLVNMVEVGEAVVLDDAA